MHERGKSALPNKLLPKLLCFVVFHISDDICAINRKIQSKD